jgi:hypothetical protein
LLANRKLVLALLELTLACVERLLAADQEFPAPLQELELLLVAPFVLTARLRRHPFRPQVDDPRIVVVDGIRVVQWRHLKPP